MEPVARKAFEEKVSAQVFEVTHLNSSPELVVINL